MRAFFLTVAGVLPLIFGWKSEKIEIVVAGVALIGAGAFV